MTVVDELLDGRQKIGLKILELEQNMVTIDKKLYKHSILTKKEIGKYLSQIEQKTRVRKSILFKGVKTLSKKDEH